MKDLRTFFPFLCAMADDSAVDNLSAEVVRRAHRGVVKDGAGPLLLLSTIPLLVSGAHCLDLIGIADIAVWATALAFQTPAQELRKCPETVSALSKQLKLPPLRRRVSAYFLRL